MIFATFTNAPSSPVMGVAVHNGHDLRPDIRQLMKLEEPIRRREEDPYTDMFASLLPMNAVVHRSRFEIDLNRPRPEAVYRTPEDAWGLDLWKTALSDEIVSESLAHYDAFYEDLSRALDVLVDIYGGFVLFDLHSFNHRRSAPGGPPEPQAANPDVNVGTGSMPGKWRPVADAFVESMGNGRVDGEGIDVRENVKFRGRQIASFVHENYGDVGCALAIEFKKIFMDEWTDILDDEAHAELRTALTSTVAPVADAWRDVNGSK